MTLVIDSSPWDDRPAAAIRFLELGAWLLTTCAVLAAIAGAVWLAIDQAPGGLRLERLTLTAAVGEQVSLDLPALGQRPIPGRRFEPVQLRRTEAGWQIGPGPDGARVVLVGPEGDRWPLISARLEDGQTITMRGRSIRVATVTDDTLKLVDTDSGHGVTWRAGRLIPDDGRLYPSCSTEGARLLGRLRRALPLPWLGPERTIFTLGGAVTCPQRWAVAGLPSQAVRIRHRPGVFRIAPGAADAPLYLGTTDYRDLAQLWVPLDDVRMMIAGRTRYRVTAAGATLTLTPVAHRDRLDGPPAASPPHGQERAYAVLPWIGAGASLDAVWHATSPTDRAVVAGALVIQVVTVLLAYLATPPRRRWALGPPILVAPFAVAVLVGLALVVGHRDTLDLAVVLGLAGLAWLGATLVLALTGRLRGLAGLIWCLVTALIGAGLVTQLQLAAGGNNDRWLGLVWKQAVCLPPTAVLAAGLAALPRPVLAALAARLLVDPAPGWVGLRWLPVLAVLGGLLALAVGGSERGVAGVLPSEPAKAVFVLVLAALGAWFTHLVGVSSRATRWPAVMVRMLAALLGLVGPMVAVLAAVRDLSPVLILGLVGLVWLGHLSLAVLTLPRRFGPVSAWSLAPPLAAFVVLGLMLALALLVVRIGDDGPQLSETARRIDRLAIWQDPDLYPVTGDQHLQAKKLIAESPLAVDPAHAFGVNGREVRLPAIEHDFIAVFLIARFGVAAAAGVIALQAMVLLALLWLSAACLSWPTGDRDFQPRFGAFLGFTLSGLATALAVHWLIGWSNPLGLLPVMGQPMTFFAAGTSHLLGFGAPVLLAGLLAAWIDQARRE